MGRCKQTARKQTCGRAASKQLVNKNRNQCSSGGGGGYGSGGAKQEVDEKRPGSSIDNGHSKVTRYSLWKEQASDRSLWNVELCCEDGTIVHACKVDLLIWSGYFNTRHNSGFPDANLGKMELKGVCGRSLRIIIEGLYSNTRISLSAENVGGVLQAADILQIVDVVQQCKVYLAGSMTASTAPSTYLLADKHSLNSVKPLAWKYMSRQLMDIVRDDVGKVAFATLGGTEILNLVKECKPKWRRGAYLIELYENLKDFSVVSLQELEKLMEVENCTLQELVELLKHPCVHNNPAFVLRVAHAQAELAKDRYEGCSLISVDEEFRTH